MRSIFSRFFLLCLLTLSGGVAQESRSLWFVESVPVETELGIPQTGRTAPVWLEMISSAQNTLDMGMFYLSSRPGQAMEPVLSAIREAANRGVRVCILADAKMARIYPDTLNALKQHPAISVRLIDVYNEMGGVMHAKYFVVDSEEVFLGSQNMDWRALSHIHELGVRVRSRQLGQLLLQIFQVDWELAGGTRQLDDPLPAVAPALHISSQHPLPFVGEDGIRGTFFLTASPPSTTPVGIPPDEATIVQLIDSARSRVDVQLLSYKSLSHHHFYEVLDNALRRAAARGVRVRIIVSNWNTRSPGIECLKSLQVVPNINIKISQIPEWSGGFIPFARVEHCKYMVVDSAIVWLGTSNWSYGYFHTSRNVALVLKGTWSARVVRDVFEKSWFSPYCQPLNVCREYHPPQISGEK